jgi:hypothetical protein
MFGASKPLLTKLAAVRLEASCVGCIFDPITVLGRCHCPWSIEAVGACSERDSKEVEVVGSAGDVGGYLP